MFLLWVLRNIHTILHFTKLANRYNLTVIIKSHVLSRPREFSVQLMTSVSRTNGR